MRLWGILPLVFACSSIETPEAEHERPEEPAPKAGAGGAAAGAENAAGASGAVAPLPEAGEGGTDGAEQPSTSGSPGVAGGGAGGMPASAGQGGAPFCCSGKFNAIGQCIDDGTVCAGGRGGAAGTESKPCDCGIWHCCLGDGCSSFREMNGCSISGCTLVAPICPN